MGMTNQEEQALMDALYGTSYDNRWHYVINDKDFEEFKMTQKGEVEEGKKEKEDGIHI